MLKPNDFRRCFKIPMATTNSLLRLIFSATGQKFLTKEWQYVTTLLASITIRNYALTLWSNINNKGYKRVHVIILIILIKVKVRDARCSNTGFCSNLGVPVRLWPIFEKLIDFVDDFNGTPGFSLFLHKCRKVADFQDFRLLATSSMAEG
jgi:hypothetical protein